jgi:manganese/zinc/iron transport system permease protein
MDTLWRALSLEDHNTRVVLAGACLFGAAAGLAGTFLLLRKRSLLGDTLGHATLPGIALAFLVAQSMGATGRSFLWLGTGAALSGLAGMGAVLFIRHYSRVKDDAALAIVLSVFFGLGVALLSAIQQLPGGQAAGLEHLIYGNPASMAATDAWFVFLAALGVIVLCVVFFKEFTLLSFDEAFANVTGWPVRLLDWMLMGIILLVTVVGIQNVGILLVVALLVIPPATARFWSDNMKVNAMVSALTGSGAALLGVLASAITRGLPTGALIVLAAVLFFGVSMLFGKRRGLVIRHLQTRAAAVRLGREHMLRAIFECAETTGRFTATRLLEIKRPWSRSEVSQRLSELAEEGLVTVSPDGNIVQFTRSGENEARRLVRNHRLWELYLINHADVAPARVDRDADLIEHVLDPRLVDELEILLDQSARDRFVPGNPEALP